jgi:hypothetical protein
MWLLMLAGAACGQPSEPAGELRVLYRERLYAAGELRALGLRVPHLGGTPELAAQGVVAGFDSEEEVVAWVRQRTEGAEARWGPFATCESRSLFHEQPMFGSPTFSLAPGEGLMSMRSVGGESWSSRISSLVVSECRGILTLYAEEKLSGESLTFSAGMRVEKLSDYPFMLGTWAGRPQSLRSLLHRDFSLSDTQSARQGFMSTALVLRAGQIVQAGTCGLPGAAGQGDTYLRLYDAQGREVAANDDSCGGLSALSYLVPPGADGPHELRVGCFGSTSCSGTVAYAFSAQGE